jgi:hypothetical protein
VRIEPAAAGVARPAIRSAHVISETTCVRPARMKLTLPSDESCGHETC